MDDSMTFRNLVKDSLAKRANGYDMDDDLYQEAIEMMDQDYGVDEYCQAHGLEVEDLEAMIRSVIFEEEATGLLTMPRRRRGCTTMIEDPDHEPFPCPSCGGDLYDHASQLDEIGDLISEDHPIFRCTRILDDGSQCNERVFWD